MSDKAAWPTTSIIDATSKIMDFRGRTPKKLGMDWGDGYIPAISARNVRMGKIDFSQEHYVASDLLYRRWMTQGDMEQGDTLITTEAPLGNVAEVPDSRRYVLSQRTVLLRPKPERFDKTYFTQVLQSPDFQSLLVQNSSGSTALGIQRKKLELLRIPEPSLAEQKCIADALKDTDDLIAALECLIAKKQAIKQGMMQQLLTGRTRLSGFSDQWRVVPLAEVSTMKGRIGWQGLTQDEFTTDGRQPFLITGMNFKDGAIRWGEVYHVPDERYMVAPEIQLHPGDVLMTKDGTIGKLLYVDSIPYPGRATLNSHLLVFRPKNSAYIPRFLYYQLGSPRFTSHIELHKSGSTFFGISQGSVGKYEMLLPSLAEQEAIVDSLTAADAVIDALQTRLAKARAMKTGMMQQLLTGRVRLPAEAAS